MRNKKVKRTSRYDFVKERYIHYISGEIKNNEDLQELFVPCDKREEKNGITWTTFKRQINWFELNYAKDAYLLRTKLGLKTEEIMNEAIQNTSKIVNKSDNIMINVLDNLINKVEQDGLDSLSNREFKLFNDNQQVIERRLNNFMKLNSVDKKEIEIVDNSERKSMLEKMAELD
jgi:hypothetical protein